MQPYGTHHHKGFKAHGNRQMEAWGHRYGGDAPRGFGAPFEQGTYLTYLARQAPMFACHSPLEHGRPLLSQEGTTQKGFKDFDLKAKAVIWP